MADVELSELEPPEEPDVNAQVEELLRDLSSEGDADAEAGLARFQARLGDHGIDLGSLLSAASDAGGAAEDVTQTTRASSGDLAGVLGELLGAAGSPKAKPKPAAGSSGASPLEQLAKQLGLTPAALLQMLKPALTTLLTGKKPKQSSSSKPKPSASTAKPKPSASTAKPKPSASTAKPKPSASTAKPKPSASTAKPKPSASTAKPKPSASTAKPKPSASTAKPKPAASTAKPKPKRSEEISDVE